jgi:hypothetical protein
VWTPGHSGRGPTLVVRCTAHHHLQMLYRFSCKTIGWLWIRKMIVTYCRVRVIQIIEERKCKENQNRWSPATIRCRDLWNERLITSASPCSVYWLSGNSGENVENKSIVSMDVCVWRSQWSRGLRHKLSSPARTLGSWVRIQLKAWMFVCVYSVFA